MVTLETADNALKTVYLGVLENQLNVNVNPLFSKIKKSTSNIAGKEIVKMAPFGINGGIGAGTETGALPTPTGNQYVKYVTTLKNLYGTIEISDKAMRVSQSSAGAFVNLLNDEMESLIKSSAFNLSRMLYGDGKGVLCNVVSASTSSNAITLDSVKNLMEGMCVQVLDITSAHTLKDGVYKIVGIDRVNKIAYLNTNFAHNVSAANSYALCVQNSYGLELTGLGAIFDKNAPTLYGVNKENNFWMNPYINEDVKEINDATIQTAIDYIEETSGSEIDFISCSSAVRRAYQQYLITYKRNIDVLNLEGGFKAISYNGIPVIADRFVADDTMYLLNTKDFELHQLCDWQWLEGNDGKIIKQKEGYPTYTATLVKYADLICDKPNGQAKLSGITA